MITGGMSSQPLPLPYCTGKYRNPSSHQRWAGSALDVCPGKCRCQVSNLTAANGRIMDVDIAAESSNLAKQQVLVQAAASMTAQANVANDVALMLLQ